MNTLCRYARLPTLLAVIMLVAGTVHAGELAGIYATQDQTLILLLETRSDGSVVGLLEDEDESYEVTLGLADGKYLGAAQNSSGRNFPVLAQLADGVFHFKVYQADAQGNVISESGVQYDFYAQNNSAEDDWNFDSSDSRGSPADPSQPRTSRGAAGAGQLAQYLSGKHILISWRNGGAIYGTYMFLNTHFCPNGQYSIYANSHKQSVVGGENRQNWEIHGRWQAVEQGGQAGIFYQDNQGSSEFTALQLTGNGVVGAAGVTYAFQGPAQCY